MNTGGVRCVEDAVPDFKISKLVLEMSMYILYIFSTSLVEFKKDLFENCKEHFRAVRDEEHST